MNGIKKVFHRNSTSNDELVESNGGLDTSAQNSSMDKSALNKTHPGSTGTKHGGSSAVTGGGSTGSATRAANGSSIVESALNTNSAAKAGDTHPTNASTVAGGAGRGAATSSASPTSPTSRSAASNSNNNTSSANEQKVPGGYGPGRSQQVATQDGSIPHSHDTGAGQHVDLSKGHVTQTVEHLGEITHRKEHTHTTEEVERQRNVERHQHHVQVHHQPIHEVDHTAEQLHQKVHPVTHIQEKHASTDKDAKLLKTVAGSHGHRDQVTQHATERQIVDKGERVTEDLHTHVHNVVVPLVSHDVHAHHRIQTVIPTQHVIHEAPIIHESSTLQAMSKADFLKGGGVLGSSVKNVESGNFLAPGQCERKVDGVAEQLERELHLKSSVHGAPN